MRAPPHPHKRRRGAYKRAVEAVEAVELSRLTVRQEADNVLDQIELFGFGCRVSGVGGKKAREEG
jgi:hypothetical protein